MRIEANGAWPELSWVATVGDASYSLYLVHIFVLAGLRVGLSPIKQEVDLVVLQGILVVAALGLSVVAALVTCHFVERPLGRFASALLGVGPSRPKPAMP